MNCQYATDLKNLTEQQEQPFVYVMGASFYKDGQSPQLLAWIVVWVFTNNLHVSVKEIYKFAFFVRNNVFALKRPFSEAFFVNK